jgi:hypothetical protein
MTFEPVLPLAGINFCYIFTYGVFTHTLILSKMSHPQIILPDAHIEHLLSHCLSHQPI